MPLDRRIVEAAADRLATANAVSREEDRLEMQRAAQQQRTASIAADVLAERLRSAHQAQQAQRTAQRSALEPIAPIAGSREERTGSQMAPVSPLERTARQQRTQAQEMAYGPIARNPAAASVLDQAIERLRNGARERAVESLHRNAELDRRSSAGGSFGPDPAFDRRSSAGGSFGPAEELPEIERRSSAGGSFGPAEEVPEPDRRSSAGGSFDTSREDTEFYVNARGNEQKQRKATTYVNPFENMTDEEYEAFQREVEDEYGRRLYAGENVTESQVRDEMLAKMYRQEAAEQKTQFEERHPETVAEYEEIYNGTPEGLTKTWFNPFDVSQTAEDRDAIRAQMNYTSEADRERRQPALEEGLRQLDLQDSMRADPAGSIAKIDAALARLDELEAMDSWQGDAGIQQQRWDLERQKALLQGYQTLQEIGDGRQEAAERGRNAYMEKDANYVLRSMHEKDTDQPGETRRTETTRYLNEEAPYLPWMIDNQLAFMTQDERDAFYILYGEDSEKGLNFLDAIRQTANERRTDTEQANWNRFVGENPVVGGIVGTVSDLSAEPLKIVSTSAMILSHVTGKEIDPNEIYNNPTQSQKQIKNATNEAIRKANGGKQTIWNDVYDTAMNIGENVTRMVTNHAIGMPSWMSTGLMAYGSFSNYYTEAAENNATHNQEDLFLTAGLSAMSEFATEALSDAHFWNAMNRGLPKDGKTWQKVGTTVWNTLVGAFSESTTEVLNDISTNQVQNWLMQDESAWNRDVQNYYRQYLQAGTYTDADEALTAARHQASVDHTNQLLHTFIVSGISGGVMDLGGSTYGSWQQNRQQLREGIEERAFEIAMEQRREQEYQRNLPENRAQNAVNTVITPTANRESGRPMYRASQLVEADNAARHGYQVGMAPDGSIVVGSYQLASYLKQQAQNARNARTAAIAQEVANTAEQARQRQAEQQQAIEEAGRNVNTLVMPSSEEGGNRQYDQAALRRAVNASREGFGVGIAPDGTIAIGRTNLAEYLQRGLNDAKAELQNRTRESGDRRLSQSQARHRSNQAEAAWSYDAAVARWNEFAENNQTETQEEQQREPGAFEQAAADMVYGTNEQIDREWDYDAALNRWREFRESWGFDAETETQSEREPLTAEEAGQDTRMAAEEYMEGRTNEQAQAEQPAENTPARQLTAEEAGQDTRAAAEEYMEGRTGERTEQPAQVPARQLTAEEAGQDTRAAAEEYMEGQQQTRTEQPAQAPARQLTAEEAGQDTRAAAEEYMEGRTDEQGQPGQERQAPEQSETQMEQPVPRAPQQTPEQTETSTPARDQAADNRERVTKLNGTESTEEAEDTDGGRTVRDTTVATTEAGDRTVTRPAEEAKSDDDGLNNRVLLLVENDEDAAAVIQLMNGESYRQRFERMMRRAGDDGLRVMKSDTIPDAQNGIGEVHETRRAPFERVFRIMDADSETQNQVENDIRAAEAAYRYGRHGQELNMQNPFILRSSEDIIRQAWEMGREQREAEVRAWNERTRENARQYGFRVYEEGQQQDSGIYFNRVINPLTQRQVQQLNVLDELAYRYGLTFNVYDTLGDQNARYNRNTASIDIALDADEGALVRAASHEAFHYVEQFNKEGAERIRDAVMDWLNNNADFDVNERLETIRRRYNESGENVDAVSELVADSMLDMLADSESVGLGVLRQNQRETGEQMKKSDVSRFADHIKELGEWMKSTIRRIAGKSSETQVLMNQAEYVETVGDLLRREVQEATNRRNEIAYGTVLRESDLAGDYFRRIQYTRHVGQEYSATKTLGLQAVVEAYGMNWMAEWMAKNGMTVSEAADQVEEVLKQYTDGEKSLDKALEDTYGVPALEEGLKRDQVVFAARQLERVRKAQQDQQQSQDRTREAVEESRSSLKMRDAMSEETAREILQRRFASGDRARNMMTKIYQMLKQGIMFNNMGHTEDSPKVGTYNIAALVQEIKNEYPIIKGMGGLRMSAETLSDRIRGMYLALDNALLEGEDFDFEQAIDYARAIAEEMADRSGYATNHNETLEEGDPILDWLSQHRGTTIYLTTGQAQEARLLYESVAEMNRKYRGWLTFTVDKKKMRSNLTLEDIQAESPWLLASDLNEGDLLERFDAMLDHAKRLRQSETVIEYNGVDRDTFVEDMSARILWGWFGAENGLTSQVIRNGQQTDQQKEYAKMIREGVKHYQQAEQKLEAEYAERLTEDREQAAKEYAEKMKNARRELKEELRQEYAEREENARQTEESARDSWHRMNQREIELQDRAKELDRRKKQLDRRETRTLQRQQAEAAVQLEEYRKKLDQQMQEDRKKLEENFQNRQKQIEEAARATANEEMREALQRDMDRYRDTVRRTQLQKRVDRVYRQLADRLLRPTNNKNVLEQHRMQVAQALGMLEPGGFEGSRRTMEFNALRSAVQNIMNEDGAMVIPDPDLDFKIKDLADRVNGQNIRSMNAQDLEATAETLESILHMISEESKSLALKRGEDLRRMQSEMKTRAEQVNTEKLAGRLARAVNRQIQGSLMDPIRFFSRMERECGQIGKDLWTMLRKSLDRQITDVDEAERRFADALKPFKNYWKWTGRNAQVLEGAGIRMTVGQAMTLYKYMQRADAARHVVGERNAKGEMVGGGIYIGLTEAEHGQRLKTMRPQHVTMAQVNAIISQLTDEQKKCADALGGIMNGWCSDLGNEVSMEMYGYRKYKDKAYIPIKIAPGYTSQTMTNDTQNAFYMIMNQGFTKSLMEHATAPIMLNDIFQLTGQHAMEMITYHAWGREMADIARLMNMKHSEETEVRESDGRTRQIRKASGSFSQDMGLLMGENAMPYFRQLIKDINGLSQDAIERSWFGSLLAKYKGAAVAWNLSTAAKQPLSFVRAFDVIPARYWAGVAARAGGLVNVAQNIREMKEHSPIYSWKQRGNFVLDAGQSVWDILFPETKKHGFEMVRGKVQDWGMKLPGAMDNWTWANIWQAAKNMVGSQNRDIQKGSERYWELVTERFNDCIDRTQVVDSILHRTQIMRGRTEYVKMITSFMGEPLKTFNTFMDKLDAFRMHKSWSTRRALLSTGAVVVAANTLQAVVASIISALRKMDDPDKFWEDFLKRLLGDYTDKNPFEVFQEAVFGSNLGSELNPMNMIPFMRDVNEIMAGYDVERSDLSVIADLYQAFQDCYKATFEDSKKTVAATCTNFVAKIANVLGIPVGNVAKEAEYLTNWIPKVMQGMGVDTLTVQYWRMRYEENIGYGKTKANFNDYVDLAMQARAIGNEALAEAVIGDLIEDGGWSRDAIEERMNKVNAGGALVEGAANTKHGYYQSWAAWEAAGDTERARQMETSIQGLRSSTEDVQKNQALYLTANRYGIEITALNKAQTEVMDAWAAAYNAGDSARANGIVNMLINHGYTSDKIETLKKAALKRVQ